MRALLFAFALILIAGPRCAVARDVPPGFADLVARLLPSVVNVASTEPASADNGGTSGGGGQSPSGASPPPASLGGGTADGAASSAPPTAAPLDKGFEQFLHSAEGPGSPDVTTGGDQMQSLGSGFIIDPSGLIVTNNHVIDGARSMSVILSDGTSLPATLVGTDTLDDIALLRVHPPYPLTAVQFGSSRRARIGDWVLAIGNPYGLGGTVTAGIISARGRNLAEDGSTDFIQTDAPINKGNSGGPLFNTAGQVIGINTAIYSPSGGSVGIGFAIPSDEVAAIVGQLRRYGKPRRGWIGVQVMGVTPDIARALKMPGRTGVVVATVVPGSPAAALHLEPGDVITSFDDHPVPDMLMLPRMVQDSAVGASVAIGYWHDGHAMTGQIKIADEPSPSAIEVPGVIAKPVEPRTAAVLGLTLSDITPALTSKFSLTGTAKGVVVTAVTPGSLAAREGLAAGDVILELGGSPVGNVQEVLDRVAQARRDHAGDVLMLVQGSDATQWISLAMS